MSDKITNELQELFKADIATAETAEKILNYFEKKRKEIKINALLFSVFWEPLLLVLELFLFLYTIRKFYLA